MRSRRAILVGFVPKGGTVVFELVSAGDGDEAALADGVSHGRLDDRRALGLIGIRRRNWQDRNCQGSC